MISKLKQSNHMGFAKSNHLFYLKDSNIRFSSIANTTADLLRPWTLCFIYKVRFS